MSSVGRESNKNYSLDSELNSERRVDEQSSVLTYVGTAEENEVTADQPKWQIKRILTIGTETITTYLSKGEFDQVWDDRNTLFPDPALDNPASLLLDGVDEFITMGDNYTFGPATAFSWSFWMKAQNVAAQRCMIAKTSQDANVYGYSFQHTNAGKLFVQVRAPSSLTSKTFATTLTAGVWYHICFTYAGGSNLNGITAYIDAAAETAPSSATLNAWTVTDPLSVGKRGTTFFFSGNLNNISVWNKELSQAEVTELHNSGTPGDLSVHSATGSLLSNWLLNNNASFPNEVDQKGSINGTLTNMELADYDAGDVP